MGKVTEESIKLYLYDVIRMGKFDDPRTGKVKLIKAVESCFAEFPTLPRDSVLPYEIAYEIAESLCL